MLGNKNPLLVDRRIYAFKGSWKSPNNDYGENIYYFISLQPTLTTELKQGREQLVQVMEITCYGEHAFVEGDYFYLQDGTKRRIEGITNEYLESNIAIRDMLKQRIGRQVLVLG